MTNEQAIEILQDELKHTQIHLRDRGKAPEFYKELGNLCKAYEMAINALEQPQGEWVKDMYDNPICNKCNSLALFDYDGKNMLKSNFCPNCGAKMKQG